MKHPLRLLIILSTILWGTTIAGASMQKLHPGIIFEKTCVFEGETYFFDSSKAAKNAPTPKVPGKGPDFVVTP